MPKKGEQFDFFRKQPGDTDEKKVPSKPEQPYIPTEEEEADALKQFEPDIKKIITEKDRQEERRKTKETFANWRQTEFPE